MPPPGSSATGSSTRTGPKVIVYELRQGVFVETARHLPGIDAALDTRPAEVTIDPAELPEYPRAHRVVASDWTHVRRSPTRAMLTR